MSDEASQKISVVISPEEFAEDLDVRLGRANGNIYHRREGVPGVHDGQVMIRLKKKRFIILDYGIVPTEADFDVAAANTHIAIPDGAGTQKCSVTECTKVGVPVLMYDSNPEEPTSLYLRAGMCFTCQRNLNEKRRTDRKRKKDVTPSEPRARHSTPIKHKKFKFNGDVLELSSDAIIINGPVDGARHHGEGYGYPEIGVDLQANLAEATAAVNRLVHVVSGESESSPQEASDLVSAAVTAGATSEDVSTLYENAFVALSKGTFLLSQWKASWDAAVAAAVNDAGLVDAVASAAAVVAAATEGQEQNIGSLLLAAEGSEGTRKEEAGEVVAL